MTRGRKQFQPFASRSRGTVVGILITFALISGLSIVLSIRATDRSQNQAKVVQVVGRQRTLAERYVKDVLLATAGKKADPALTGSTLSDSAHVLLDGGTTPAVNGDDDDTKVPRATGTALRRQLAEEENVVADLRATGAAILAQRPATSVPITGGEHLLTNDPIERLRVLAALTSNVALNASRTIVMTNDQNISDLKTLQIVLGVGGLMLTLLLAWALIGATRRQTAHYRSLVQSSSDLVLIIGPSGCRYASRSLTAMVGRAEPDVLGRGYEELIHEDDRAVVPARGSPRARCRAQRARHDRACPPRGGAHAAVAARQLW